MAFAASAGMPFQDVNEPYMDGPQLHYQNLPGMSDAKSTYYGTALPPPISCDIKPRLTKEQHDILEAHYQKQNKPNTNTKKGFAEALNVSLDKVNNWFQNRRAKSKQDAKKAGAFNLFPSIVNNGNFSDTETSPAFISQDYFAMMQQCAMEEQNAASYGLGQIPTYHGQLDAAGLVSAYATNQYPSNGLHVPYATQGMFDSPQELNRRTLTQESFNAMTAMAQGGSMMSAPTHTDSHQQDLPSDTGTLHQSFPELSQEGAEQHADYAFSTAYSDPLSSSDSSIPSSISEHSVFPSSTATDITNLSASPDEWATSRSSSMSFPVMPDMQAQFPHVSQSTQQSASASSQWQPGQSKPVQLETLQQQFREAQALHAPQLTQPQHQEEPLAWPDDDALLRRESSSSSLLTQQMSHFALQTPQPDAQAQFKIPQQPANSIAARRHVKRPAALGIASLRSTSYSGNPGPASPGQGLKTAPQTLRRIQSSMALNSVSQGRVNKGPAGSAQRSPLNFTFSESINSPKALRHAASGNTLVPPSPLSPAEMMHGEANGSLPTPVWPSQARHASISETDAEYATFGPNAGHPSHQNFSSPPHTPMFNSQYHPLMQNRFGNAILENTPPQSAPAGQTCFPGNTFMMSHQPTSMPPPPVPHMVPPPSMPCFVPQQTQQIAHSSIAEHQYPSAMMPFQPTQQQQFIPMLSGIQSAMSMQQPSPFTIDGSVLDTPTQMPSYMQAGMNMQAGSYINNMSPTPSSSTGTSVPQLMSSPLQGLQFVSSSPSENSPEQQTHSSKQSTPATELFVHEYSPPQEVKQGTTPRKTGLDLGPKNYTFANHGPEHYEKDRSKKGSVTSSSPESSTDL